MSYEEFVVGRALRKMATELKTKLLVLSKKNEAEYVVLCSREKGSYIVWHAKIKDSEAQFYWGNYLISDGFKDYYEEIVVLYLSKFKDQYLTEAKSKTDKLYKSLYDFLSKQEHIDCEVVVADVEMLHSLVWDSGCRILEYGLKKYDKLLNSPVEVYENGNIEVLCDDEAMGKEFFAAAAGYISSTEYDKIFHSVEIKK